MWGMSSKTASLYLHLTGFARVEFLCLASSHLDFGHVYSMMSSFQFSQASRGSTYRQDIQGCKCGLILNHRQEEVTLLS